MLELIAVSENQLRHASPGVDTYSLQTVTRSIVTALRVTDSDHHVLIGVYQGILMFADQILIILLVIGLLSNTFGWKG